MQDENPNSQPPQASSPEPVAQPLATETTPPPMQPVITTPPMQELTTPAQTSAPEAPKPENEKKEGGILSFVVTLLIAFALVQIINMFLFQSYKVFGSSMYSTLHDGDRLIISKVGRTGTKITGKHYTPKRGEVIVFIDPQNTSIQLIKRVIGLPGERVVVKDGTITVYNSENPQGFNPDDAEYGKNLPAEKTGDKDITVPANHLFVSGDNRAGSNSLDSRNELGTVPEDNIVGVLKVRIFPFDSATFF